MDNVSAVRADKDQMGNSVSAIKEEIKTDMVPLDLAKKSEKKTADKLENS
jgi:hypothetical protein